MTRLRILSLAALAALLLPSLALAAPGNRTAGDAPRQTTTSGERPTLVETAVLASGAPADVVGVHTWTVEPFGTAITISATVALDADGVPVLTDVTVDESALAEGTTASVGEIRFRMSEHKAASKAAVEIVAGDQTARLVVGVKTNLGDDPTSVVRYALFLEPPAEPAEGAGTFTWEGILCDGSTAAITYTVAADASVTIDAVTVDGEVAADVRIKTSDSGHAAKVRFAEGGVVGIRARVDETGAVQVDVQASTSCEKPDRSADRSAETDERTSPENRTRPEEGTTRSEPPTRETRAR